MYLIMLILITFASTADSFIIGFNYGLKKVRINGMSNFYISIVTGLGTLLSMYFGKLFSSFLLPKSGNMIGGLVLILLGIYMLKSTLFPKDGKMQEMTINPEMVDENHSKVIELKEALLIGLILSINNIGMGVGAGITGMPIFITPIICGIASFLFIKSGSVLGRSLQRTKLSKHLEVISAVFVLILGILGFYN